jgi:toxin ParE1/3/4
MNSVRLTPQAKADLNDIWDYTAKQWNIDQAEAYMRALDATFHLLVLNPRLGCNIDDIRKGYFKFPTASHILIYRVNKAQIEIVRILHKSSDVEARLYNKN